MVYFLRNQSGKNYFEVEVFNGKEGFDLSSEVYSYNYCKHLLDLQSKNEDINKWLECLEFLEEFRGWFWETYVPQNNNYKNFDEQKARNDIKSKLQEVADILQLSIVED